MKNVVEKIKAFIRSARTRFMAKRKALNMRLAGLNVANPDKLPVMSAREYRKIQKALDKQWQDMEREAGIL